MRTAFFAFWLTFFWAGIGLITKLAISDLFPDLSRAVRIEKLVVRLVYPIFNFWVAPCTPRMALTLASLPLWWLLIPVLVLDLWMPRS